ncbi:MAG: hypothetical protein Q4D96_02920 [Propionibacteriaceae bacterium]|nr:hypothetical protein [Propionibacteriaceae bacterium]
MKLTCPRYPELWLPKHNVRFVDGVAEVSQQKGERILAESPHVALLDPTDDEPEVGADPTDDEPEVEPEPKSARRRRN